MFCNVLCYCSAFLFRALIMCTVRLRCANSIFLIVPLRQLICTLLHPRCHHGTRVAPAVLTVCTVADVDECAGGSAGCSADASCSNFAGGFTCTCNGGYEGDGSTCDGKPVQTLRLCSRRHECESEYPYAGSKKHEFACISTAAVHIDTSSVRVRVTCEFHSYEQFLWRSCFYPTRVK